MSVAALVTVPEQEAMARHQNELSMFVPRQQYEDPYRNVVEDLLEPLCRFGPDFRLTFVNRPYAAMYGKQPSELIGRNIVEVVPLAYQAQVLAHLSSLNAQNPVGVDENPVHLADGSLRWFHWTNRFIEQADGRIEYQGVGRDITDRKQAEDAEREQRRFAEAMRDSLAALTSSLDVDQVMAQILASAAAVVPSEGGSIILIENGYGRVAYCRGFGPEVTVALQQNHFAIDPLLNLRNALAHKAPYVVLDTRVAEDWVAFPLTNWIRSSIGVPIECDGQMIGLLVADSAAPNYFKPGDVDKLQAFARYAGLALSNAYHTAMLEQRVAERTAELQAVEQKFRQLIQAAPVAIIISDQAGQITLANNQAEVLLGYQAAELLHQSIEILVPEAIRAAHIGKRMGYTANLQMREMSRRLELVACRKDGSLVPVEIQLSYIETTDGVLIMSFILDITERKQAAEALRYQRDFLQSVIDHIPGIITVKNRQGCFQLANQYTAQLLGTTPAAIMGKTSSELNPNKQEVDAIRQLADKVFLAQQALSVPEGLLSGRYYQANLIPLPGVTADDDQVLIVASDITDRKESEIALQQTLQRERELSELKTGFITTTSHEFRTPLAIILSTTETLRTFRHKLAAEQIDQRLDRIANQVLHMKALMEDVFDLSRMQARRVNFTPVHHNPATLCLDLISEFQDHAETMRHLRYTYDDDLPLADLDERLLRQILNNLISNAIKYSADDKLIAIHLACAGHTLVLTVRDEGIGIPAADRKHLFLPFYRATNVGTIPGTGLGLSITKEAIELHRGIITVESEIGVGTTFTVKLPVTAEHKTVKAEEQH